MDWGVADCSDDGGGGWKECGGVVGETVYINLHPENEFATHGRISSLSITNIIIFNAKRFGVRGRIQSLYASES